MVEVLIMNQAKWVADSFIAFSAYNVTELFKPTYCIILCAEILIFPKISETSYKKPNANCLHKPSKYSTTDIAVYSFLT